VWATGACEVIQDFQFVSAAQYSRRQLACTEGLQETICVPVYKRVLAGQPPLTGDDAGPVGVLEVVLASSQHAANGSMLAIEGRVRLSAGGTAAVITSIGTALDAAGLSCCADAAHHGYATAAPQQKAPCSATTAAPAEGHGANARSSFDAARVAAGFDELSAHGSDGSARSCPLSGSMARTSSYRSFHGSPAASPCGR